MKTNYTCSNFDCLFETKNESSMLIKDLNKQINDMGGHVSENSSVCPKCKKNTLVYVSE